MPQKKNVFEDQKRVRLIMIIYFKYNILNLRLRCVKGVILLTLLWLNEHCLKFYSQPPKI